MHVAVQEYNPEWPAQFETIKEEIETALIGVKRVSIEHVGSTSVPGLAAKPVIDLSVISDREDIEAAIEALTLQGGYTYMGTMGIPDRHAFRKRDILPTRNLYVSVKDCQSIRNHLALRDLCRRDDMVRDRYGQVKLELSRREWKSVDDYCEAKTAVISWILEQAGLSEEERDAIRRINTTGAT
ncbi:uncharacterized protein A1O9_03093 [Exophiala aquamarina CBS 119918]|uniref:GrpB family protein n=1 Tax=Exophiala aquamarina CBS 119918 TaxID=1182545 RepID=A0A072PNQ7_9EURO|nr:uncharacterized protein A1O9_03093 [Exophiala aquamarina CBS 119918]KEF61526.1 hypothetical protein A1O9_03093 [Exophiala aquamarina CBS 119918]